MAESPDTSPSAANFVAQTVVLTTQVQENTNKFMAFEDENVLYVVTIVLSWNVSPLSRLHLNSLMNNGSKSRFLTCICW